MSHALADPVESGAPCSPQAVLDRSPRAKTAWEDDWDHDWDDDDWDDVDQLDDDWDDDEGSDGGDEFDALDPDGW